MMLKRVLLPQPDGPMIETKRPASATMSTDVEGLHLAVAAPEALAHADDLDRLPGGRQRGGGRGRAHQRSSLCVERCHGITIRSMMTTIRNSTSVSSMVMITAPNTRSVR